LFYFFSPLFDYFFQADLTGFLCLEHTRKGVQSAFDPTTVFGRFFGARLRTQFENHWKFIFK